MRHLIKHKLQHFFRLRGSLKQGCITYLCINGSPGNWSFLLLSIKDQYHRTCEHSCCFKAMNIYHFVPEERILLFCKLLSENRLPNQKAITIKHRVYMLLFSSVPAWITVIDFPELRGQSRAGHNETKHRKKIIVDFGETLGWGTIDGKSNCSF